MLRASHSQTAGRWCCYALILSRRWKKKWEKKTFRPNRMKLLKQKATTKKQAAKEWNEAIRWYVLTICVIIPLADALLHHHHHHHRLASQPTPCRVFLSRLKCMPGTTFAVSHHSLSWQACCIVAGPQKNFEYRLPTCSVFTNRRTGDAAKCKEVVKIIVNYVYIVSTRIDAGAWLR